MTTQDPVDGPADNMAHGSADAAGPKRRLGDLSLTELSEVIRNIGFGVGAVLAAVGAVSAYLLDNFTKSYGGTGEDRLFLTLAIFLLSMAAMAVVTGYLYAVGRMLAGMAEHAPAGWKRVAVGVFRVGVGLFLGLILAATFWGMMAAFAALTETVFDIWRQVRR